MPEADRHCDGSPIAACEPATGRLQSQEVNPLFIDWGGNGAAAAPQDVNFDGRKDGVFSATEHARAEGHLTIERTSA